jgi:hypothetical protein
MVVSFILAMLCAAGSMKAEEEAKNQEPKWKYDTFREIARPMPEGIMKMALELSGIHSDLRFGVTYMGVAFDDLPKSGGFLTVKIGDEAIHVAAWPEWRYRAEPLDGVASAEPRNARNHRKVCIRDK